MENYLYKNMSENIKSITKDTLIPIGLAITLLGGVYYLGYLSANIKQNTDSINELKSTVQSAPTQYQFISLQEDVSEVKADVKELKKGLDELKLK